MEIKKIAAFAAALMMIFGSTAVYAFAEETTNEQDIAVEQVLDEFNESELYASAGKVDAEQNALARKAKFSVEIAIRLKDGSTISTGWKADNVTKTDKGYTFKTHITIDDIQAKITAAGKTIEDFDFLVYNIGTSFDKSLGIDDNYRIKYFLPHLQGKLFDKDGNLRITYSSNVATSSSGKPVLITKTPDEKYKMHGYNMVNAVSGYNIAYIEDTINIDLERAIVYKPTKAHLDSMKLKYTPTVTLITKDGKEIATDWKFNMTVGDYENFIFEYKFTITELESILKKSGKNLSDLKNIQYYLSISNPSNSGIAGKSTIEGLNFGYILTRTLKDQKNSVINTHNGDETEKAAASYKFDQKRIKAATVSILPATLSYWDNSDVDENGIVISENKKERDLEYDDIESVTLNITVSCYNAEVTVQINNDKTVKGDANGDKKIDVADIAVAATHIKGIKALTAEQIKAADVNKDNNVNVADIAMIASHIKGIKALK